MVYLPVSEYGSLSLPSRWNTELPASCPFQVTSERLGICPSFRDIFLGVGMTLLYFVVLHAFLALSQRQEEEGMDLSLPE
jgi:hypothetical protein